MEIPYVDFFFVFNPGFRQVVYSCYVAFKNAIGANVVLTSKPLIPQRSIFELLFLPFPLKYKAGLR